jgi:hypothetical protein
MGGGNSEYVIYYTYTAPSPPTPPSPLKPFVTLWERGTLEGVGPETHIHKITNVSVFFISRLDFMILMLAKE